MHFPRMDLTCMGLTCEIPPRILSGGLGDKRGRRSRVWDTVRRTRGRGHKKMRRGKERKSRGRDKGCKGRGSRDSRKFFCFMEDIGIGFAHRLRTSIPQLLLFLFPRDVIKCVDLWRIVALGLRIDLGLLYFSFFQSKGLEQEEFLPCSGVSCDCITTGIATALFSFYHALHSQVYNGVHRVI